MSGGRRLPRSPTTPRCALWCAFLVLVKYKGFIHTGLLAGEACLLYSLMLDVMVTWYSSAQPSGCCVAEHVYVPGTGSCAPANSTSLMHCTTHLARGNLCYRVQHAASLHKQPKVFIRFFMLQIPLILIGHEYQEQLWQPYITLWPFLVCSRRSRLTAGRTSRRTKRCSLSLPGCGAAPTRTMGPRCLRDLELASMPGTAQTDSNERPAAALS